MKARNMKLLCNYLSSIEEAISAIDIPSSRDVIENISDDLSSIAKSLEIIAEVIERSSLLNASEDYPIVEVRGDVDVGIGSSLSVDTASNFGPLEVKIVPNEPEETKEEATAEETPEEATTDEPIDTEGGVSSDEQGTEGVR